MAVAARALLTFEPLPERAAPSLAELSAATHPPRLVRVDDIADVVIEYFPQAEGRADLIPGEVLRLERLPVAEDDGDEEGGRRK